MTKRELIDEIMDINHTAGPDFLAEFADTELDDYLRHLREARQPRPVKSSRQTSQAIRTPFPHVACNTEVAACSTDQSVMDTTNPLGNVTISVADFSARENCTGKMHGHTGFCNPSKTSVHQPSQAQDDGQAWLF